MVPIQTDCVCHHLLYVFHWQLVRQSDKQCCTHANVPTSIRLFILSVCLCLKLCTLGNMAEIEESPYELHENVQLAEAPPNRRLVKIWAKLWKSIFSKSFLASVLLVIILLYLILTHGENGLLMLPETHPNICGGGAALDQQELDGKTESVHFPTTFTSVATAPNGFPCSPSGGISLLTKMGQSFHLSGLEVDQICHHLFPIQDDRRCIIEGLNITAGSCIQVTGQVLRHSSYYRYPCLRECYH